MGSLIVSIYQPEALSNQEPPRCVQVSESCPSVLGLTMRFDANEYTWASSHGMDLHRWLPSRPCLEGAWGERSGRSASSTSWTGLCGRVPRGSDALPWLAGRRHR
jgi:hypothetical protein